VRLPKFQTLRPGGLLGRVEDNVAEFARALTDERSGLLAHGLTTTDNARGRVFRLQSVTVPDDWQPLNLAASWVLFGAAQFGANVAARSDDFGFCEARGAIRANGAVSAGSRILDFTSAFAPMADGNRRTVVEVLGSAGAVEIIPPVSGAPAGAINYAWGNTSFLDLSSVRWRAAGGPVPWPVASQVVVPLGDDYPGSPELVRVEDASPGDGTHFGPLPVWWRLDRIGNAPAVRLVRIGGLRPLITYNLTLSVLSA
jgi:hypothetical protein